MHRRSRSFKLEEVENKGLPSLSLLLPLPVYIMEPQNSWAKCSMMMIGRMDGSPTDRPTSSSSTITEFSALIHQSRPGRTRVRRTREKQEQGRRSRRRLRTRIRNCSQITITLHTKDGEVQPEQREGGLGALPKETRPLLFLL